MFEQDWAQAFGQGLHLSVDATTATVGNGFGNLIGGDVTTEGSSTSNAGFGNGEISIAVDATTAVVGNGAGNVVLGDVVTQGHASAGGVDHIESDIPFVGHMDIAVDTTTAVVGNGFGNLIGGDVFTSGGADAGHHLPF